MFSTHILKMGSNNMPKEVPVVCFWHCCTSSSTDFGKVNKNAKRTEMKQKKRRKKRPFSTPNFQENVHRFPI